MLLATHPWQGRCEGTNTSATGQLKVYTVELLEDTWQDIDMRCRQTIPYFFFFVSSV